jgi:glycosyltransferase involved in cell wall biosynthesis
MKKLIIGWTGDKPMRTKPGRFKKLTVLIPCHNEAKGIGKVLQKIPFEKLRRNRLETQVIVIDNCSTDNTAQVAESCGALVLHEGKKGKGNAMRTGFSAVPADSDYVVMLDGDDTYDAGEITRMVEPLENNFCNVVVGSRLGGKMQHGAMRMFNRGGNWLFTHLVRTYYKVNVTDVLTGYFAWNKRTIDELKPHLESDGFAIEMEMITKMAKLGHDIYSVPISYTPREGETNLRPVQDGLRILKMWLRDLFWRPRFKQPRPQLETPGADAA